MATALAPPSFDEAEDTEAPLSPPAFNEAQDTDAPMRPPSFEDAEDIPPPAAPTSSPTGDFIKRVASSTTQATMQIGRGLLYADEKVNMLGKLSKAVFGPADPFDLMRKEVVRFAADVQEGAPAELAVDPAREGTIPSKLAAAVGSVIPIVASGGTLAPIVAGAMMGESGREEAEAAGASESAQLATFGLNAGVGVVSEFALGIPKLLRSAKAVATTGKGAVREIAEQVGRTAVREGAQEGGEQFLQNVIAKGIYDPERGVLDGVPEAVALGAAVGGPLGGIVQTATTVDAQRTGELKTGLEQDIAALGLTPEEQAQPPLAPLTVTEDEISTGPAAPKPAPNQPAPPATPADPNDFVAVLEIGGKPIEGLTNDGHKEIFERHTKDMDKNSPEYEAAVLAYADDSKHVFKNTKDPNAKELSRDDLATALGETKPMQSERLRVLKAEWAAKATAATAQPSTSEPTAPPAPAAETSSQGTEVVAAPVEPGTPAPVTQSSTTQPQPVPPKAAPPAAPAAPTDQSPTGIRNAIVDKERVERGLPERMAPLRRSFGRLWDEAMARVDKDAQAGPNLVAEISENPRPLEDWESALLAHEQVTRQNAFDKAVADVNANPGNPEAAAALTTARDDVQAIYDAGQKAGTKSGQSLAARKLLVNDDYPLAKMEAVTRAVVNDGKPLTTQQASEVAALHKRIAETEKKLAEYESKETERASQDAFDNLLKELKSEAKAEAKSGKTLTDFLDTQADKARARIRKRSGALNIGINPAELADHVIIGSSWIAKGVTKLADFTARMVKEFGEAIRPHLPDIFSKAKNYHDANASLFGRGAKPQKSAVEAAKANAAAGKPLSEGVVFDLAREKVRGGAVGLDAVMKAVHAELEPLHPGLTEREVRDAFSGYGKRTFPSKEADLVALRELRRLGQLVSSIEDANRKQKPAKSGMQRDAPTQAVREKLKELHEAMKANDIETTDPETQLKSSNAARATALRNQIADLDKQLQTGAKPTKGSPAPDTPEVETLRAERDAMKEKLAEIEAEANPPLPEHVEELRRLQDRVDETRDRLARLYLERPSGKATVDTAEIAAAKAELKSLNETITELRKPAKPSDAEKQVEQLSKLREKLDQTLSGAIDPKTGKPFVALSAAAADIKAEILAMQELAAQMRRDAKPKTDPAAAKERAQIKALEDAIERYRQKTEAGDFTSPGKTQGPDTAKVAALKELRDSRRAMYETAKNAGKPVRLPDEIRLEADKKAIATRTRKLQEKIAANDYTRPVKKDPLMDDAKVSLMFENKKAKEDYARGLFEADLAKRNVAQKILGGISEVISTSKAIMTAVDLSAVGRQGGFIAFGNPLRAIRAIPDMIRALFSERAQFRAMEQIKQRENSKSGLYDRAKLFLSDDTSVNLKKLEEQFNSRWAQKIPVVAGSGRAFNTFLNRLRADTFDAMVASLAKGAKPTIEEVKAVANYINVATGRGTIISGPILGSVFFAPKLVASRFQLIGGQPFYKGTNRTRLLIAKEYGKFLTGIAAMYALAAAFSDKDDKEPVIEFDPRSSDFGKIRIGNTRIDPLVGLAQVSVLLTRVGTGEKKTLKGKVLPLTGKVPYGGDTTSSILGRFARTKFSPLVGAIVNAREGKNVVGQPTKPGKEALGLVLPLSLRDVYDVMKEHGVPTGTALTVVSLFGFGMQNYSDKKPAKAADGT